MVKSLRFLLVLFLLVGFTFPVSAQWVVDLTVPLYPQETNYWCGAASSQMILDAYPNLPPLNCSQADVWAVIDANNLPGEPANWATDPHGLQQSLMILRPPVGGTWSLMTDADRDALMFQVLYWMNRNAYPVTTLVYRAAHWIVITGYETDIEPVAGSTPTLQSITINDPWPPLQGATTTMTGTAWFANYWYGTVNAPGTWYGYYVAIIEPPVAQGDVEVEVESRAGDKSSAITPQQAVDYAKYWITQKNLSAKDKSYSLLSTKILSNLDPILVREETNYTAKKSTVVPYYYIVPFGTKEDIEKETATVCVVVNAFTGNFEEVSAFGKPAAFIEEAKAIGAAKALVSKSLSDDQSAILADVVFIPCPLTYLRVYPLWKITLKDTVVYVEMNGKAHLTLQPSTIMYGK